MTGAPVVATSPLLLASRGFADYALVDSGAGRKLERYGAHLLVRPEPQCLWTPGAPEIWEAADAVFEPRGGDEESGRWRLARPLPPSWSMTWRDVKFLVKLTAFRHLGVFPEHAATWSWLKERLGGSRPGFRLLNLFGYTGIASLAAAQAGAAVTHVDAARKAVAWARENAAASGLGSAPIRWLAEDASRWVEREARRGARYDGILLDPPKYGRGPKGEVWRLLEHLPALLGGCASLLSNEASFLLINAYAERMSGLALAGLMAEALSGRGGRIEWGELALMEEDRERGVGLSFFARWIAP
ncbi:MAG TPA: class I SAM-dependent methyltransferase [Caulobacteraceae bacterium]|nr:class I SAM-dependent methyltransferase [Caulobacteraceae bacterium]